MDNIDFLNIKDAQKLIIEKRDQEAWIKDSIINVLDIQISLLPTLDQKQYTILINSAEHPEGYKLDLTAHPTLRIRDGNIVKDKNGNPDSYFWDEKTYQKNKSKCDKYFLIGTETGDHLENYCQIRDMLKSPEDRRELSFKVASRKWPLEVMVSHTEGRIGIEVTEDLVKELPSLLESYNDYDINATVDLKVGDLLILDSNGYYYRVEKSLKEQTYHKQAKLKGDWD